MDRSVSIVSKIGRNHHVQSIPTKYTIVLNLHTTTGLNLVGKEYMCFQNDGKTDQAARCIKSRIMTKLIDSVLSIDTFEQQCVVLKGMLQSPCIKYHVQNIGIDQYLSKNVLKTSRNYTNMLVSVTTNNNSKIFLMPL